MSEATAIATDNLIEFVGPILGFEHEREFTLLPLENSGTLWVLESTQTPQLQFVAAVPGPFFPGYAPVVAGDSVTALSAEDDELTVLVILTVDGPIRTATANLLAPLVLAPKRHRAMQIVLADDTLPVRAPLQPAAAR